jgi:hypothetical protein
MGSAVETASKGRNRYVFYHLVKCITNTHSLVVGQGNVRNCE